MRMWVEAGAGRDFIVVPHAQMAEAHTRGVAITSETEVMVRVQPFIPESAESRKLTNFDHRGGARC
jgi:hypothetical protein